MDLCYWQKAGHLIPLFLGSSSHGHLSLAAKLQLTMVNTSARERGRGMAKIENPKEQLRVDSDDYFWKVRHSWLVDSGKGLKGISVSVWRDPGKTREIVIDFPFALFGLNRSPKRSDLVAALIPAIRSGIKAGW